MPTPEPQPRPTLLALLLLALIRIWQYALSPLLPPSCRFEPSCSAYGAEAVRQHGALRGGLLTARRISRCHPWGGSGYDPVPAAESGQKRRGS